MSEIVKSEYNALGEDNNYKTHYFKTSADQVVGLGRMKNTEYQVGDVVYSDTNNKVALRCISNGTTSNTELDISGKNIGDTITDGNVVWEVVPRFLPAETINEIANELIEELFVGFVGTYAGNTPPAGWLSCEGASLNPQTYTRLFGRIGTTYGGNGSTTFNLPNLNNNSFLEGSNTAGTVKNAGLPNVYGKVGIRKVIDGGVGSVFDIFNHLWCSDIAENANALWKLADAADISVGVDARAGAGKADAIELDASRSSSVYGNADTVQPKSVTVKFCIKY